MIYVWNDQDGQGPDWEIPELPEYSPDRYLAWNHSILEIKTHPREIVENLVDTGHFMPTGRTRRSSATSSTGTSASSSTRASRIPSAAAPIRTCSRRPITGRRTWSRT
jgi:phenylpropionate dioxygenase-like ring-hydroxylating dioxygenase large terminal subunit